MDDVKQLIGGTLMVDLPGETVTTEDADFLRQYHIRAVCLFRRNLVNVAQTQKLVDDLRAIVGDKLLIAIDQEGGAVMRTAFLPQAPSAMALGAVNDEALAAEVGAAVARGLASLGINWNWAPVLDLNNNPHNPIIAERSFGADPVQATLLASAWVYGHLAERVATCIKHFPGHGDTNIDTHRAMAVVNKPLEILEQYELAPFRALAGVSPALMSAHILFPALDKDLPATLSAPILQSLLRDKWHYSGVTTTDSMNMEAIRAQWGQAKATVMAIQAGADLSLVLQHREEMIATYNALAAALEANALSIDRLKQANARLSAMAQRYPSAQRFYGLQQEAADRVLFASVWKRALTFIARAGQGGELQQPPQRPPLGGRVRLVVAEYTPSDGVSEASLSPQALIDHLKPLYQLEVLTYNKAGLQWDHLPKDGAFTLLASTARRRYNQSQVAGWKPDLHLVLWNPYLAADLDAPALLTYGFTDAALEAVAAWLKGELEAQGVMPA